MTAYRISMSDMSAGDRRAAGYNAYSEGRMTEDDRSTGLGLAASYCAAACSGVSAGV